MIDVSRRFMLLGGAFIGASVAVPTVGFSSNHFDVELVKDEPGLDITDVYVFPNKEKDNTVVVVPARIASEAADLHFPGALFNIHLSEDDEYKKGMTLSFSFQGDGGEAYLLDQPNGEVGATGAKLGDLRVGEEIKFDNGIRFWTGRAKDPFFGNSPGMGAFRKQLTEGRYDPELWSKSSGKNIFAGASSAPIVVEIPNTLLGTSVRVFATVARKVPSGWEQVQYLAKPLLAHSMLFENAVLKMAYDASRPTSQEQFQSIFAARIARAAALAKSRDNPFSYADETAAKLLPDVIHYKVGSDARFAVEDMNGRALSDDGMATTLTLMIGQPTDHAIKDQKLYTDVFPYVIAL